MALSRRCKIARKQHCEVEGNSSHRRDRNRKALLSRWRIDVTHVFMRQQVLLPPLSRYNQKFAVRSSVQLSNLRKEIMPTDVVMPQMGESIFEGTITKWLKQPGEKVQRDEPLFEISTDKVDAEIPAPASGTLQEIKVQAGNTVQVNTIVGVIAGDGDASAA